MVEVSGSRLLDSVHRVRAALSSHSALFEVTLFEVGPLSSTEELARAQERLGVELPSLLHELYARSAYVNLEWATRSEECLRRGYREELAYQEATLRIIPLNELREHRRESGIVEITSDFAGRAWALDLRWGVSPIPVVFFESAYWEGDDHEPDYDSLDQMWPSFAEFGFVTKPTSQADLVWEVINRGALPDPPG